MDPEDLPSLLQFLSEALLEGAARTMDRQPGDRHSYSRDRAPGEISTGVFMDPDYGEFVLSEARTQLGLTPRLSQGRPDNPYAHDSRNIQNLQDMLFELEALPPEQRSLEMQDLMMSIPTYLNARTGFQDGGMVSPILDLPPDQFFSALDELGLPDDQREFLLSQYGAPEPRTSVPDDRSFGYHLLDNLIGFDDDYVTRGEALGAGVRDVLSAVASDPVGAARAVAEGTYDLIDRGMRGEATPVEMLELASMPVTGSLGMARMSRAADEFLSQFPSDELGYFHSAYVPSRVSLQQMAQPGYQFNPAEVSYLNRMDEAYRMRDAGATNPEIFEQTRIMLVPQRDESGNIIGEVALTATPRAGAAPTQVAPDARARTATLNPALIPEIRDLIDFGPDVEGLVPGGPPRSPVTFGHLRPGVLGEHDPTQDAVRVGTSPEALREFDRTLAHEGEHTIQNLSGLDPLARGTNPDVMPGNSPAERFAMYEANLGEMLARRAMGDDTTAAAAGIMQALNPFLRTGLHAPDLRRGELIPRFTARVPANIFEGNRNAVPR